MKSILELIADVPTNAVLRLQAQALEKKVAELEKKCAGLESQVSSLKQELSAKTIPTEFIEHRGALFKRRPNGGYDDDVRCRVCKQPMVSFIGESPFHCEQCGVTVNFNGSDLPRLLLEIKRL
jgi:hypothetical protein